jgi:hypothetical protein
MTTLTKSGTFSVSNPISTAYVAELMTTNARYVVTSSLLQNDATTIGAPLHSILFNKRVCFLVAHCSSLFPLTVFFAGVATMGRLTALNAGL